jgi:hypothetical protein
MEIFKPIKGYENLYEISNYGNVKSLKQKPSYKGQSYLEERILKPSLQKRKHTSYKLVTLSKNRKAKTFSVHRLVASAFIENKHNKPQVNHIDNNGEINHYKNLEWCTSKENMEHSSTQGRQDNCHYLGGLAAGKLKAEKAKTLWDSRIGKTFGGLKILEIYSYGKHPKGKTKCIHCSREQQSSLDSIIKGNKFGCRSCGLKESYRKRKVKI